MKIKTYYAKTINDALKQAKYEYGDGVVILESRQAGGSRFLKRKNNLIEISVAIDSDNKKMSGQDNGVSFRQVIDNSQKKLKRRLTSTKPQINSYLDQNDQNGAIANEMTILHHELNKLNRRLRKMTAPDFPEPFSKVLDKLAVTGISSEDAITFIRRAYLRLENESRITQKKVLESVKKEVLSLFHPNRLSENIDEEKPKSDNSHRKVKFIDSVKSEVLSLFEKNGRLAQKDKKERKIVAVVGPTGVGKTTILMKLAVHPEIYGKKNVTIVSTDSYRIAAAESWKVFSKITSIPFKELKDLQNLRNEIDKMSNMDVVLIDMPGRSPLFSGYLQELQNNLAIIEPTDIQLVLSATSDLEDLYHLAGLYRTLNPTGIIFTKIDETTRPGKIISAMREINLPVSYISNGQSIPTDIRDDAGEFIWENFLELI